MTELYLAILIILGIAATPLAVSLILLVCDLKPDRTSDLERSHK